MIEVINHLPDKHPCPLIWLICSFVPSGQHSFNLHGLITRNLCYISQWVSVCIVGWFFRLNQHDRLMIKHGNLTRWFDFKCLVILQFETFAHPLYNQHMYIVSFAAAARPVHVPTWLCYCAICCMRGRWRIFDWFRLWLSASIIHSYLSTLIVNWSLKQYQWTAFGHDCRQHAYFFVGLSTTI